MCGATFRLRELARRVGLDGILGDDVAAWKQRLLGRLRPYGIDLQRLRSGAVKNPFATEVLFADRVFSTPTGKVNLIHELPDELLRAPVTQHLTLVARSTDKAQSSQWPAATQQGPATATVHPAAAAGVHDGQLVQLRTVRGTMQVRLKFDAQQRTDQLLMDKGGWLHAGRCANTLIEAELTDDGECAVYYDTPVQIEPVVSDPADDVTPSRRETNR